MHDDPEYRLDKTVISIGKLADEGDDRAYWLTKTPEERLRACEMMRRMIYGEDRATSRLQRVIEVVKLPQR